MKTKKPVSPSPAESTAVRIGGRALQVAAEQALGNGMTLRPTVETIILAWHHNHAAQQQGIGAAVVAKVEAGQEPVAAAVQAIKERLRPINGKAKTGVGKPQGAPAKKGARK